MRSRKKWIWNFAFLFLVLGLTVYGLFHDSDLSALLALMGEARWGWWLLGVVLVVAFILGESLVFHDMLKAMDLRHKLGHCFLYSFVGFFFSCITPSAGGGQPAQVYFMKKDGIELKDSIPIMLMVTITYKLVLVLYALGILLFRPTGVLTALEPVKLWCVLGFFLNVIFISFYILLMLRPGWVEKFLSRCIRLTGRFLGAERQSVLEEKLERWMVQYRDAATDILRHKKMLLRVMALTVAQRTVLFSVTYFAIISFNIAEAAFGTVLCFQAMIAMGTDLLPLPGGMGASETMFLKIYPALCGEGLTLPVLLVSRGISYYGQLLISAVFTLVAFWRLGRKQRTEKRGNL